MACDAVTTIRRKLDLGLLPRNRPAQVYAGYGRLLPCDGCEKPILPAEMEHEFDADDGTTIRLHVACAALLSAELQRRSSSGLAEETAFDAPDPSSW